MHDLYPACYCTLFVEMYDFICSQESSCIHL